jgi:hypothetical protein
MATAKTAVLTPSKTYRLTDYDRIKNEGFTMTLSQETINIIKKISGQVGAPEYIKTPNFERRTHKPAKGGPPTQPLVYNFDAKSNNNNNNDWDMLRNFKKTVVEQKEGVNLSIDLIRKHLNKMTDKTYDSMRDQIINEIDALITSTDANTDESKEVLQKVGDAIFTIASGNGFYSKMYATLYNVLMTKYEFMKTIINANLKNINNIFQDFAYCDPNVDYDTFCKNNKTNEKRRALSLFYINLMLQNIIPPQTIITMLNELQSYLLTSIAEPNKTNIAEEVAEVISIWVVNGISKLQTYEQEWTQIVRIISKVGTMKHKSEPSITNKTIFKHIAMLELIK